jgi:hypothetical protein
MKRRKGLLHNLDLAVLTLLCIIFCFLIPFILSFGFNIPIPKPGCWFLNGLHRLISEPLLSDL